MLFFLLNFAFFYYNLFSFYRRRSCSRRCRRRCRFLVLLFLLLLFCTECIDIDCQCVQPTTAVGSFILVRPLLGEKKENSFTTCTPKLFYFQVFFFFLAAGSSEGKKNVTRLSFAEVPICLFHSISLLLIVRTKTIENADVCEKIYILFHGGAITQSVLLLFLLL